MRRPRVPCSRPSCRGRGLWRPVLLLRPVPVPAPAGKRAPAEGWSRVGSGLVLCERHRAEVMASDDPAGALMTAELRARITAEWKAAGRVPDWERLGLSMTGIRMEEAA